MKCAQCSNPAKVKGLCKPHYIAAWRASNRQKMLAGLRKYYLSHREKFKYKRPDSEEKRIRKNNYNKQWRVRNQALNRDLQAKYYEKNFAKIAARVSKDRKNNPQKYIEAAKKYIEKHRDKLRLKRAEKYAADPAKIIAKNRAWNQANPDAVSARAARYRARKLKAAGSYTSADVHSLYKHQNGECNQCHVALGRKYDVDHIIPLSRGGDNWPTNLQLLCVSCNRRKSNKLPWEAACQTMSL